MKELSLNILDIVKNSVKAKASLIGITLAETEETLTLTITDNGCGMLPEVLRGVIDPFYTTRTTRKVGLGIPLLKLAAEQTGGEVRIESTHESLSATCHGTTVTAVFYKKHIDFTPLGDLASTMVTLIQGSPEIDFDLIHTSPTRTVQLRTSEMREVLGDVPLNTPEVLTWIDQSIREQYSNSL